MISPSLKSRQSIMWANASRSSSSSNPKMGTSPIMVTVVDIFIVSCSQPTGLRSIYADAAESQANGWAALHHIIAECGFEYEDSLSTLLPRRLVILGIKHHITSAAFAFTLGGKGGVVAESQMDQTALAR